MFHVAMEIALSYIIVSIIDYVTSILGHFFLTGVQPFQIYDSCSENSETSRQKYVHIQ